MKALATFTIAALLAGGAIAQTSGSGRASGGPPLDDRAPGTAASDVAPGRPTQAEGADAGDRANRRQHDAVGSSGPSRGDARRANRDRDASAAQSYGYPASSAQGR